MAQNPLVTIVTPSYNQAAFLEQTILSVLAQDYQPVEYLIVDGASTDGSLEIIRRYADRLAWWVSEPDSGQAEAINKGLGRAKGEIVAWLNSDDLYLPGAISQAVAALGANSDLGMVFGDALTIDSQGIPLGKLAFGDWGLAELVGLRIICQPAVFMRRSVLEKAGLVDPSYHFMLDHHLWIRIARLAPIEYMGLSSPRKTSGQRSGLWAAARHHPAAKNVAQPAGFSKETIRLLEWMESQPDLAPFLADHRRQVLAGAHRLSARYLLDGGMPGEALKSYGRALLARPGYALKHWHRMVYALICLSGLGWAANRLRERASRRKRRNLIRELKQYRMLVDLPAGLESHHSGLEGWPGLRLDLIQ
jgi:glycosyltransferase involved in cell wall biosynthesis